MTRHSLITKARHLRVKQTEAEAILWEELRKYKLNGFKIRRQHPLGRYIADFYCPQAKVVIELDGKIHDRIGVREYDAIRQAAIESLGIKVLRFKNEAIIINLEKVLDEIKTTLKARQV